MRRASVALVALVAAASCNGSFETFPCGTPVTVCVATEVLPVDDAVVDFETPCDGSACAVTTTQGTAEVGASFHPGDHALWLHGASSVDLTLSDITLTEGATLDVNVRCATGSRLLFLGSDRADVRPSQQLATSDDVWQRRSWTLQVPYDVVDSLAAAPRDRGSVHLRFASEGTAYCQLDRVVYTATVRLCTQHQVEQMECIRYTPPPQDATTGEPDDDDATFSGIDATPDADAGTAPDATPDAAPDAMDDATPDVRATVDMDAGG